LIHAFSTGFITLLSLILAVGAQNIFVLRQGLLRRHVAAICLFAALSDAILIWTGVIGFGIISTIAPSFTQIITWIGALFLATYGGLRFWAAYKGVYDVEITQGGTTLRKALVTLAAFTLLNPHVYLDTLGLIGAVSAQYGSMADKYAFATGASFGSLVFFFGLGYGARVLAPVMTSPKAWRFLDIGVGLTMWTIAVFIIAT
jgi:L-lysine exporter family protein LysE/ArgO